MVKRIIILNKSLFLLMFLSTTVFAQIGQVVALKGDVKLERESKIQELLLKDKVLENDQITTLNDSRTQLLLNDETVITVGENSIFKMDEYLLNEEKDSTLKMNFLNGTFKVITGKIGKLNPDSFKIQTKNASIGISLSLRVGSPDLKIITPSFHLSPSGTTSVTSDQARKILASDFSASLKETVSVG